MSEALQPNRRHFLTGLGGLAAGAMFAPGRIEAGLLEPPGPPGPTMLPLSDIEPRTIVNEVNTPGNDEAMFVISEPGSYYLVENLTVPAGKIGIVIDADDVTLDLRGHLIAMGVLGHGGIRCGPGERSGIVVRTGALTGEGFPIDLAYDGGHSSIVERILVKKHSPNGILVGPYSQVLSCFLAEITDDAIVAGEASIVLGCHVGRSGVISSFRAISMAADGIVADCRVFGSHVTKCGDDCLIQDCALVLATGDGNLVRGCDTFDHSLEGIGVRNECLVWGCQLRQSQVAGVVAAGGRNVIVDNNSLARSGNVPFSVQGTGNLVARNTMSHPEAQPLIAVDGNSWHLVRRVAAEGFSGDEGVSSPVLDDVDANVSSN